MTTDTTEKGLESLVVRAGLVAPGAVLLWEVATGLSRGRAAALQAQSPA